MSTNVLSVVPLVTGRLDAATQVEPLIEKRQRLPPGYFVRVVVSDKRLDRAANKPLIEVLRLAANILALRSVRLSSRTVMFCFSDGGTGIRSSRHVLYVLHAKCGTAG